MKCDYCRKKIEGEEPKVMYCENEPMAHYHKKCAQAVNRWFESGDAKGAHNGGD